jgi:phosphoglycerate kinase
MSHLGRPKAKPDPKLSLATCAKRLSELLKKNVIMAPDSIGPEVEQLAHQLKAGEVLLLENLRFRRGEEHPEEEPNFVKSLARLGDVYINDAFGTAHRAHASTAVIAQFFPGKAATGFLMEKEIHFLDSILLNPKRPFYAILGGAKISSKFNVIEALLKKADHLFIGGAMAYTFFKSEKIPIGNSLYEEEFVNVARQMLDITEESKCPIYLPVDIVCARRIAADAESQVVNIKNGIPDGFEGVDIGPQTIKKFGEELRHAGTVFWNGPLGVFECPPFAKGTYEIAKLLASLSAVTVVGGGDSVAAIEQMGLADKFSHLSTGGGASLEYIEYGTLPGIEALSKK